MASNVSTVDGMGFEEVNQSSYTEIISGTNVYGTNVYGSIISGINISGTSIRGTTIIGVISISGTTLFGTNISGTNFRVGGSVIDTQGRYRSALIGSATINVFGGFMQVGSFLTNAGSQGVIKFGLPYSSATSYYVNTTACGSAQGFTESYISGTSRNASGCDFVGAPSLRYDWIAVGI